MVTDNHYRWDFIQLSTDTKPTPATSPKVANGSTLYTSDDSKLYVWYKDQWYEKTVSGGGTTYTAGDGIVINEGTIGVDLAQTTGSSTTKVMSQDATTDAINGIVLTGSGAPTTSTTGTVGQLYEDTTNGKLYQCTDATNPYVWSEVGAGGSSVNVVQTTGTSTTDVMSQDAVTKMVYSGDQGGIKDKIRMGTSASTTGSRSVAIGYSAIASGAYGIALGDGNATQNNSLGINGEAKGIASIAMPGSSTSIKGVFEIGLNKSIGYITFGYNDTAYRLLTGLYDGQGLHDAATVAQGNTLSTSAPTTSTVGVLGQLYTDTTNMHTYQCTAISGDTYTWTQRW